MPRGVSPVLANLPTVALLMIATACGAPSRGPAIQDTPTQDITCDTACVDSLDCAGKPCTGGFCECDQGTVQTDDSCTSSRNCTPGKYCRFPSLSPWVDGTVGVCEVPCDNSCPVSQGYFQTCHDGQCYSEIPCDTAAAMCPPGSVCSPSTSTCTAPPADCNFDQQCPAGWLCHTDRTCIDPNDISFGSCSTHAECANLQACAQQSCTCTGGDCVPLAGCQSDAACPPGNYCTNSVCRPADPCVEQSSCTPYDLVCRDGYCLSPATCTSTADCGSGKTCNTALGGCFPDNATCVRDEQCAAGSYCEIFVGSCLVGCRGDSNCSTATPVCGGTHQCQAAGSTVSNTEVCADTSQCNSGRVCAPSSPTAAILCNIDSGQCEAKSCRTQCDILLSQVDDTCPDDEACGGSSGAEGIIFSIVQRLMGISSDSASVCYPD